MELSDLPLLNACLNGTATVFIVCGLVMIKRGKKRAHIVCMVIALIVSAAFLTSYLIYHSNAEPTKFATPGLPRAIYFFILLTHIPLAAAVVPLVLMTVIPALRRRFDRHKKVARITVPVWLYVSVTGVLVYMMLYRWYPPH